MKRAFNRYFFMGLKGVELHYARYASGTGYKRHVDQHHNTTFRKITIVIYLTLIGQRMTVESCLSMIHSIRREF